VTELQTSDDAMVICVSVYFET
jgi:hypothetical protein